MGGATTAGRARWRWDVRAWLGGGRVAIRLAVVADASTDLGRRTAVELAAGGAHVLAGVRTGEDADLVRRLSPRIEPIRLDPSDAEDRAVLADHLADEPFGLDLLVNDVGQAGSIALTQACLPALLRARGRVVNTAAASRPEAAAPLALMQELAREVARSGLTVTAVSPGLGAPAAAPRAEDAARLVVHAATVRWPKSRYR